jgi:methyl-accepting chemotaxis protein
MKVFESIAARLLLWSCSAAFLVILAIVLFIRFAMIPQMTDEALMAHTETLSLTIKGAFSDPAKWSDAALARPEALDAITDNGRTIATLFVAKGDDFIRAATTLKKEDGTRAIGTRLDPATPAFRALSQGQAYTGQIELFKHPHVASYQPVTLPDGRRGAVFVGVGYDSANGMVKLAKRMSLIVALAGTLGVALLAACLAFAIRAVLTRRLASFARMTTSLASGKGDLTLRLDASSHDELGRVATAMNTLLDLLHDMFANFKSSAAQIHASSRDLGEVIESTNGQILTQQTLTAQVADAMERISVAIEEIRERSAQSKTTSHEAEAGTARSVADLRELSGSLGETEHSITTATRLTETFLRDVAQIDTLIALVSEIAEQTNLLALNAAIEAARAGESGRGFAVVADEVRKLANRSAETVIRIRDTTSRLSVQSSQVSGAMDSGERSLHQSVECLHQVEEALNGIQTLALQMAQGADNVADRVGQQALAVQEVAASMASLAEASENTAHQMGLGAKIAAGFRAGSDSLNETLNGFRTH